MPVGLSWYHGTLWGEFLLRREEKDPQSRNSGHSQPKTDRILKWKFWAFAPATLKWILCFLINEQRTPTPSPWRRTESVVRVQSMMWLSSNIWKWMYLTWENKTSIIRHTLPYSHFMELRLLMLVRRLHGRHHLLPLLHPHSHHDFLCHLDWISASVWRSTGILPNPSFRPT